MSSRVGGARPTHCGTIEDWPCAAPDTKRGAAKGREAEVVDGADATADDNEDGRDGVSYPDAQPRLPPRETAGNHGRGNHPRANVDAVGDPEADIVPGSPEPALLLDRFQIEIVEL